MRKTMIALGLVVVILLGLTYAYAQSPAFGPVGPGHRGMHPQESWGPGKDLSLTPDQKAQLQELHRKFRQENAQLFGALMTKRLELQSLWTDSKADPKVILDKEKELRDLQNQMKDKIVQSTLEARKLLTPEQIANWKPGRGMGRGHMMGHGGMMGCGQGMGPGYGIRN